MAPVVAKDQHDPHCSSHASMYQNIVYIFQALEHIQASNRLGATLQLHADVLANMQWLWLALKPLHLALVLDLSHSTCKAPRSLQTESARDQAEHIPYIHQVAPPFSRQSMSFGTGACAYLSHTPRLLRASACLQGDDHNQVLLRGCKNGRTSNLPKGIPRI